MSGTSLAVRQEAKKPDRARVNARRRTKNVQTAQRVLHRWLDSNTSATRACVEAGLAQITEMREALARPMPDSNGDVVQEIPYDDLASIVRRAEDVLALTERIAAQVRRATADMTDMTMALCGSVTWEAPGSENLAQHRISAALLGA